MDLLKGRRQLDQVRPKSTLGDDMIGCLGGSYNDLGCQLCLGPKVYVIKSLGARVIVVHKNERVIPESFASERLPDRYNVGMLYPAPAFNRLHGNLVGKTKALNPAQRVRFAIFAAHALIDAGLVSKYLCRFFLSQVERVERMVLVQVLWKTIILGIDGLQDHLVLLVKLLAQCIRDEESVNGLLVRQKVGHVWERRVVQVILELEWWRRA